MSGFMVFGGKSKFPIIISPEMDREKMLFYLEKQLIYERANQVARRGDLITFSGNFLTFVRVRSFLNSIGRGFIRVTAEEERLIVTYRLSFTGFFSILLLGGFILTVAVINGGMADPGSLLGIALFLCVVVGFNIFIQLVSLAIFIERIYDSFMKE
jgi:hypothetical protein